MIPVTPDDLEQLAFDTGATISMGGRVPTVTIGRLTFGAVDEHPAADLATLDDRAGVRAS